MDRPKIVACTPMAAAEEPAYLSANKVCKLMGICRTTLWRLTKNCPTFPKGVVITPDKTVWKKSAILEWMDNGGAKA